MEYLVRWEIKVQALIDFITDFTNFLVEENFDKSSMALLPCWRDEGYE